VKNCVPTLILVCCMVSLALTGCWDRKELNEISLISGFAIDKGEEKKFKLSVESINITELSPKTKGAETPAVVYTQEGDSISELARKMNVGLSRKLILSHMSVVILSEEVAKTSLLEVLDFMDRFREVRNDFNLVIAKEGKAGDILTVLYPFQKISTLKIRRQLNTLEEEWGGDPDVRLKDFIQALVSKGKSPVAPALTISGSVNERGPTDNMKNVRPPALVTVPGLAVFKDDKLVGYLPLVGARDYLWTHNKMNRTSISVPCAKGQYFNARVYNSSTRVKARSQDGIPHVTVRIKVETILDGTQCEADLSKLDTYRQFEKMTSDIIEKEVAGTIKRVQQDFGTDIFGFGEKMHVQDPAYYHKVSGNWDAAFAKARIQVEVNARMRRAGLDTKSFLNQLKP
jgi:spore germination protein KC